MSFGLGFWAAAGAGATNSYELISSTTLNATTTTVSFASIPSGYKHLQVRVTSRSTSASTNASYRLSFNSDTTSGNYTSHLLYADGSTVGSTQVAGAAGMVFTSTMPGANATTNAFGAAIFDILDFASTTKNKTVRAFTGWYQAVSSPFGYVQLDSGLWMSTAAITSISFNTNNDYVSGSRFSLYGIRG